jgi:hypothetical protein
MKNLVNLTLLAVMLFVVLSSSAQITREEKKKIELINAEIGKYEFEIRRLNDQSKEDYSYQIDKIKIAIDSLTGTSPETENGRVLKASVIKEKTVELGALEKKQAQFSLTRSERSRFDSLRLIRMSQKNLILDKYLNDLSVQKLTSRERDRFFRGLQVTTAFRKENNESRYDELAYTKMKNTKIEADSVLGYKGIIENQSLYREVSFVIYRVGMDGKLDKVAAKMVGQNSREYQYLFPGTYKAVYTDNYGKSGTSDFDVPCFDCSYKGEKTAFYVYWKK